MSRSSSFDPLDKFRWRVYIANPAGSNFIRGGFTSCSSPGITINVNTYAEGGSHMNPRKIIDGAVCKPITLKRGVIAKNGADDFSKWVEDVFKVTSPEIAVNPGAQYRNDIVIEHLDRDGTVIIRWILRDCVPTMYEPASDFDAMGENEVSIETLTFEYEGFEEERPGNIINDVGDILRRSTRGIF